MHRSSLLLCLWGLACSGVAAGADILDLAGEWRLRLDPADEGVAAHWPAQPLASTDRITLPNTTDLAGFGFPLDTNTLRHTAPFPVTTRFPGVREPSRADEHGYLVRRWLYVGPAWFERDVVIPASWTNRLMTLRLERALWRTDAWVDGRHVGACDSLVAEHRYDLGPLAPGRHRLTVRVDNRMIHNLSTITHAYGPETQSRWNGLIGALTLTAAPRVSIHSLAAFPAADRRSLRARLHVHNAESQAESARLKLRLSPAQAQVVLAERVEEISCPSGRSTQEFALRLAEPAQPWDEFEPVRYRLHAALERPGHPAAEADVLFGFRHLERVGRGLYLNGRPLFLRGTLDCAVYPKTGHPPMSVAEWERVMGVVKEYGFNHVRFHTWCPPEAAFEAADRLGLYLQPEAPAWVDDWTTHTVTRPSGIGRDPQVTEFLQRELRRMSEAYGNHPSFLLCVLGNEFGQQTTDWERVNAMIAEIRALDPRRLYAACTARRSLPADDFWITHHTGASARGVGPGHTDWDFARAVDSSPLPVIAHETGQRPVFPDYDTLLPKFTGPLLPLNLERYRRALVTNGLAAQAQDFVRASARFQFTLYKAEHEAMRRTRYWGGFQLLMLHDFTGQSEALVGLLDPFFESKGVIRPAEVRAWNAPTVLLARFAKFTWLSEETFRAQIEVSHFGPTDLSAGPVSWLLKTRQGHTLVRGQFDAPPVPAGSLTALGAVTASLAQVTAPLALTCSARFADVENQWPLWVYPAWPVEPEPADVRVTTVLDDTAMQALRRGGKVLLLGHGVRNRHAASTGFESVYWSAGWWGNKFSSLGLWCDPAHPALEEFPTDGCSDWQWRELCAGATTFDLTGAPPDFRPIVQPVPDFHFNTLLGQVFETRVGPGSLLVCGYDLSRDLDRRPAARQFRRSLFRYVAGPAFRPATELPATWLEARFQSAGLRRQGASILRVSSEDQAHGHLAEHVLDGDSATFWHTRWQPASDPLPHELVVDLGRERLLSGLRLLPRQDQANGRIARAEIFASTNGEDWGAPLLEWRGANTGELQTARFPEPRRARFLRLRVTAEVNGQPFASLAELELISAGEAD